MATRSAIPGTKAGATDSISVAEFNDLPGGLIGYATVTSNQTSITTLTALTGLTLTLTPGASRILRIGYALTVTSDTASDEFQVRIYKDGTQISRLNWACSSFKNGSAVGSVLDIGPTNASHTYLLQMGESATSAGTFSLQASSTQPATLYVEDVGPQF